MFFHEKFINYLSLIKSMVNKILGISKESQRLRRRMFLEYIAQLKGYSIEEAEKKLEEFLARGR